MAEKKSVTVTIYKNEYTLKGDADPQHIIDLAHYVDTRMTEMGQKSSAPADKIAILVAMNIADELNRLEKVNEDNLEIIENLEKNLEEIKNHSNNTIQNAAAQNEEIDRVQTQLIPEKEKYQALEDDYIKLQELNMNLKNEVESLSKNPTLDLNIVLEEQRILTHEAQTEVKKLKTQCESLEIQLREAKNALEKKPELATPLPSLIHNVTISDDKLNRLITKINAVID